jgi:hypothetical protein
MTNQMHLTWGDYRFYYDVVVATTKTPQTHSGSAPKVPEQPGLLNEPSLRVLH